MHGARALVHDMGAPLNHLGHLPVVKVLLAEVTSVSCLSLKAVRCIIIFNSLLASEANCLAGQEWLRLQRLRWGDHVCSTHQRLRNCIRTSCWPEPMEQGLEKTSS